MGDAADDGTDRDRPSEVASESRSAAGETGATSSSGAPGTTGPSIPGLGSLATPPLSSWLRSGPGRTTDDSSDGSSARSGGLAGRLVSLRHFAAILAAALAGAIVFGELLPWSGAGNLLGVFLAAAGVGLGARGRHYLEATAAGAFTAGLGAAVSPWLQSLLGLGSQVAFGVGAGALIALIGHHAGRVCRGYLE